MPSADRQSPLWEPTQGDRERAEMTHFMRWAAQRRGHDFEDYQDLWRWSVDELEEFWASIWEFCGVRSSRAYEQPLEERRMPGAKWFAGAELNYAENVLAPLRWQDGDRSLQTAVLHSSELRALGELTWGELTEQVAAVAGGLRSLGVGRGDRVVAYMPNIPETLVAFLATASLGAIWSSAAPEFGARSVIDRFAQIEPKVLLAVDGYRHGGKDFDRLGVVEAIRAELPSVEHTVLLPYLNESARLDGALGWQELASMGEGADRRSSASFEQVPFDHPLWVLYSSGTTGLPKAIVQGHGGILVEQLKKRMHLDLQPGDRMFWFTTTGWMMWNFLVGCLLSDAAIVLYDGSPAHPDLNALWSLAERARITCMGVSAGLLASCEKAGVEPRRDHDLSALRAIGSTGSPLAPESFKWVYEHVGDQHLAVLDERRHRRVHGVRRRLSAAARLRRRTAMPSAGLRGRVLGRAGPRARRPGRRAGDHRADALDAAVPVGRRRRRALARELLRDVPGRVAARRLDPDHATGRSGDLRSL